MNNTNNFIFDQTLSAFSTITATPLTPEQLTTIRTVFDKFDKDKSGTLDKVELRGVLEETLKRKVSDMLFNKYLELQFNDSDKNFNGVIEFEEFASLYSKIHLNPELPIHMGYKKSPEVHHTLETGANAPKVVHQEVVLTDAELAEARVAFDKYDANKSGTIDRTELAQLLRATIAKRVGEMMMTRLVDSHMQLADKDNSGEIDFNEFIVIFKKVLAQQAK
ncbi:hypothetical protein SAMD00019534_065150 [Acytostelium subglobosum LB1]|uniref:hypothetical protein n=1 Tax=Acytostelium subglobosum LB1 TaxID=1410327 RepID=UPI000644A75F|nr:hypothetical protein SAMD00019534_065150 [Acytostelium subglobosum LB1]GAM23340.1 hypothetical protein SAMD00019534_065150 [Acytostelium subglobosum LB1]|eukprot:XP_012753789.1 hypothetical protein SAMD00019534_065150 [Acytostelium subglobosum LB1]